MIETSLMTHLKSVLASQVADRVFYVTAPQKVEAPYVVFRKTPLTPFYAHDGAAGMAQSHFEFYIYAETYKGCKDIVALFDLTNGTLEGTVIGSCMKTGENDGYENSLFVIELDYLIIHQED